MRVKATSSFRVIVLSLQIQLNRSSLTLIYFIWKSRASNGVGKASADLGGTRKSKVSQGFEFGSKGEGGRGFFKVPILSPALTSRGLVGSPSISPYMLNCN